MPRYTISANQEQFSTLFSLLDRGDETSSDVWNLVRMLATNQQMYQEVLSMSKAQSGDSIDWAKVFEDKSVYRQIYKQEIIVAVMESGGDSDDGKRVMFSEEQQIAANAQAGYKTQAPSVGSVTQNDSPASLSEAEERKGESQ
mmetsp:Transcript_394/g.567  ORF Transcript_394/g.567 Transcript_394/m.567 type:complete len:143 (-) Transcript_394:494-922(-)